MQFRTIFQADRVAADLPAVKPGAVGRSEIAHVETIWFSHDLKMLARDARVIDEDHWHIRNGIPAAASDHHARRFDLEPLTCRRA